MKRSITLDVSAAGGRRSSNAPVPGLLMVFHAGRAECVPLPLAEKLELGRDSLEKLVGHRDNTVSHQHVEVIYDGACWQVRDLNSRNGTFVDQEKVSLRTGSDLGVLRAGHALFLFLRDLRPFEGGELRVRDGVVIGPTLGHAWSAIERAAKHGAVVHLHGETGAGKELAARHFHESGPRRRGPFVSANCATLPTALAERLLFGARRGAYSGADSDSEGFIQAADGGTLFLDEIGELDLSVQAKLLRVLETREVVALGATRGKKVDFGLVSATHADLKRRVANAHFPASGSRAWPCRRCASGAKRSRRSSSRRSRPARPPRTPR
jgi:hypothetical protein